METKASAKWQILIPSSIRQTFNIIEGTRIQIDVDEQANAIILTPITRKFIHNLRGKYKGSELIDELTVEKRLEREL